MINVVDVTQHYGVRSVLRGVNLKVERGELVALMGPNGMGKTTLMGVMAGVLSPQNGYVEIDGKRRRHSIEEELAIRKKVAYLADQPWLPNNRTGREFLLSVGRLYEVDERRLIDHVERLLQLFQLKEQGDSPIRSYSNGQKKKAAICSVLVTEAPVLLLDEPFSGGLDPSGLMVLRQVLKRLTKETGATVVMASPVAELVEGLADRVAVIRDGQIAACDTTDGLRRLTNTSGSLQEVLERLIRPQTLEDIDRYFEGRKS
jgi:ABC-type multidrug transport system ATPase subunit